MPNEQFHPFLEQHGNALLGLCLAITSMLAAIASGCSLTPVYISELTFTSPSAYAKKIPSSAVTVCDPEGVPDTIRIEWPGGRELFSIYDIHTFIDRDVSAAFSPYFEETVQSKSPEGSDSEYEIRVRINDLRLSNEGPPISTVPGTGAPSTVGLLVWSVGIFHYGTSEPIYTHSERVVGSVSAGGLAGTRAVIHNVLEIALSDLISDFQEWGGTANLVALTSPDSTGITVDSGSEVEEGQPSN